MIDKIFEMLIEEARSRPGDDFSRKLYYVCIELDAKIMDKFEELNPDFYVWLPDDPEELAKVQPKQYWEEVKKRYDRRDI